MTALSRPPSAGSAFLVWVTSPATAKRRQPTATPRLYPVGLSWLIALTGAEASASLAGVNDRARIATRTCDGRPLAAAGVNLKSVSARPLPDSVAASLGSALPGVKE